MSGLYNELKRRNVFRVGAAYAVVGWLIIQIGDVAADNLAFPDWFMPMLFVVIGLGFPVALLFSWAFEMTPDGVKKTAEVDADASITPSTGQKLNYTIIAALVLALGFIAWDKLGFDPATVPIVEADAIKTIAVLPFVNMSNDPEQEFFSDGISEELLNVLAKVDGLRVTSRTSAFKFKGTNLSVPEVAAELGVQYVLEGSVRRGAGEVRITAQLIDVATDSHLWSETYDRDISNIFAVQDEIASKVAGALRVALLGADARPIAAALGTDPDLYSSYLRARQLMTAFSFGGMREAERLLGQVIAADPDYAPAYDALVTLYLNMGETGILSLSEAYARAEPQVERALALNDRQSSTWLARAIMLDYSGKHEGAAEARQRAYALEPNNPGVLRDRIMSETWKRHPRDMSPVIDELFAVDPLHVQTFSKVAFWYNRQGSFDEFRKILERFQSTFPDNSTALFISWMGPTPETDNAVKLADARAGHELVGTDPDHPSLISLLLMDGGRVQGVPDLLDEGRALDESHAFVRIAEALYKQFRGDLPGALEIAAELAQPDASSRFGSRDIALRMLTAQVISADSEVELISLYLSAYPGFEGADLSTAFLSSAQHMKWGQLTEVDLAVLFERSGEAEQVRALLDAVEAELPFWPRRGVYGIGFADAELYAIRGQDERALAALRQALDEGLTQYWWFFLDHSPHFADLRGTPEFAVIRAQFVALAALPEMKSE